MAHSEYQRAPITRCNACEDLMNLAGKRHLVGKAILRSFGWQQPDRLIEVDLVPTDRRNFLTPLTREQQ